jgi:hypothetical protein
MTPGWVDLLMMTGAFLLVAIGGLLWIFFLRQNRRRRRKHHHHHHSRPLDLRPPANDGLPPDRRGQKTSGPPPAP